MHTLTEIQHDQGKRRLALISFICTTSLSFFVMIITNQWKRDMITLVFYGVWLLFTVVPLILAYRGITMQAWGEAIVTWIVAFFVAALIQPYIIPLLLSSLLGLSLTVALVKGLGGDPIGLLPTKRSRRHPPGTPDPYWENLRRQVLSTQPPPPRPLVAAPPKPTNPKSSSGWESNGSTHDVPSHPAPTTSTSDQYLFGALDFVKRKRETVHVMFRISYRGPVLIFPTLPADGSGQNCVCIYMEQNVVAIESRDYFDARDNTRPVNGSSNNEHYAILLDYLSQKGILYEEIQKVHDSRHGERIKLAKRISHSLHQTNGRTIDQSHWLTHPRL